MSADCFHHQVEQSMKFKKNLYDFANFTNAVQNANSGKTKVIEMSIQHFFDWVDLSAQTQIKKIKPRPYLADFTSVMVERGKTSLSVTENYNFENVRQFEFLKIKNQKQSILLLEERTQPRGISLDKKYRIIEKLCPLMTGDRQVFWRELSENQFSNDLNTSME